MKRVVLALVIIAILIPVNNHVEAKKSLKKAPGIALEDTKGKFTMMSSLLSRGNLIISFWSYDCVPCRREMPELQALTKKKYFKDKKIKLVFVYVEATTAKSKKETSDRPAKEKAIEVLKKLKVKETCLLDIYGVAFNNYRKISGIKKATLPLLYLINKKKEIVFSALGFNKRNIQNLEKAIKKKL